MAELRLAKEDSTPISGDGEINPAQHRRLRRLDLLLAWDGSFGRKDLTEFFGISDQQASADIAKYREIAPDNSWYDTKTKLHMVSAEFKPVVVTPSADRYLDQLQSLIAGNLLPGETWFRDVPSCDTVPRFNPDVRNNTLMGVLRAIRENRAIKIRYQPLTRPDSSIRWIAPHALAFSGRRWHARAFCFEAKAFRDFVLTRIMDVLEYRNVEIDESENSISSTDTQWHNQIKVKMVPCRGLTEDQRRVIAKDYDIPLQGKIIPVREALFLYFVDWHRLDPKKYGQIPENQRMVEVENWDEISSYLPEGASKAVKDVPQLT